MIDDEERSYARALAVAQRLGIPPSLYQVAAQVFEETAAANLEAEALRAPGEVSV